jgi:predicted nucleotidyltransferase
MTRAPDEAFAALRALEAALGRAPVAAVLSGSAVAGGLRRLSDIDLLVVVEEAPAPHPDLAIALAQARAIGVALLGPPPRELLDPVPEADLRRALRDVLPALLADLRGDERNVLLTLARMWHTAATGAFAAKDAAAAWAAARLPTRLATWLALAGRAYVGEIEDDWRSHRGRAAELAERLRWQVERACGALGDGGTVWSG